MLKKIRVSFNIAKKSVTTSNNWLIGKTSKHPITLVPIFMLYLLLSIGIFFIVAILIIAIFMLFPELQVEVMEFFWILFSGLLVLLVWFHYIFLGIKSFMASFTVQGDRTKILRIIQTLVAVIFSFAVLFYFLQLFSDNEAFSGMHRITFDSINNKIPTAFEKLQHIPSYETVIDCIYLSVVTLTTSAYGDIYPNQWYSKLLTCTEVIVGFSFIVLALGSVVGGSNSNPEEGES